MHPHNHDPHCHSCAGGGLESYRADMRRIIQAHQVAIAGVMGGAAGEPAFAYTVGLSLHGLPEILIIANYGIPLNALQTVLNTVAFRWLDKGNATLGVDLEVLRPFGAIPMPVELVCVNPAQAKADWTVQVEPILGAGHGYEVVQLILPDDHGRLPSMEDYNVEKFPQPLLTPSDLSRGTALH